ncbi:unnamed protein product [Clavelina lepadiformis]|uniref:SAYSvFN domain-containing protein n=1 Tax=Clavelina lepadiformis TaxID=159417 RepID=A0ABP0H0A2_CLALP
MEKKLSEYRARKQAEFGKTCRTLSRPSSTKRPHVLVAWWRRFTNYVIKSSAYEATVTKLKALPVVGKPFILKMLLWLLLFGLFVELEFGIVYVVLSFFVIIYYNTSTKKRGKNELSAYSVFNKDFERLDGTFTAEQFEKELTHRM